jgi:aspartyl-tRNA(Asn)/glutamyl-tRNA(Gln) amidotransferase subunit B
MDYRYFPEPDLPALVLTSEYIDARKPQELPIDRRIRYLEVNKLGEDDARILAGDPAIASYYDELSTLSGDPKRSCSMITTVLFALFGEQTISFTNLKFEIGELAAVIRMINNSELSSTSAKTVVETLFREGGKTSEIVERLCLKQSNDTSALESIVDTVISASSAQIAEYKAGNARLFGYFVGECMKASQGKGNPKIFNELLKKKLG